MSVGWWDSQYTVSLFFFLIGHRPEFYIISAYMIFGGIIPLSSNSDIAHRSNSQNSGKVITNNICIIYTHITNLISSKQFAPLIQLTKLPRYNSRFSSSLPCASTWICHDLTRSERQTNSSPWKIYDFDGVFSQEEFEKIQRLCEFTRGFLWKPCFFWLGS